MDAVQVLERYKREGSEYETPDSDDEDANYFYHSMQPEDFMEAMLFFEYMFGRPAASHVPVHAHMSKR